VVHGERLEQRRFDHDPRRSEGDLRHDGLPLRDHCRTRREQVVLRGVRQRDRPGEHRSASAATTPATATATTPASTPAATGATASATPASTPASVGAVPRTAGDRAHARAGEDEDPPRELQRRPNHEAPKPTQSRPRDRSEPEAGHRQARRVPEPTGRRPAMSLTHPRDCGSSYPAWNMVKCSFLGPPGEVPPTPVVPPLEVP
jgi:hypothetical protein